MNREQRRELEEFLEGQDYSLIHVDLANPRKVIVGHDLAAFRKEDLEKALKFFVFNDDFMRIYSRKGPKDYILQEVKKADFDPGYIEREYFVDYSQYKSLMMRIGTRKGKEVVQYMHFQK